MRQMMLPYRRHIGESSADDADDRSADESCSCIILPDGTLDDQNDTVARLRAILSKECGADSKDEKKQAFIVELDGVSVLARLASLGFRVIDNTVSNGTTFTWTLAASG